MSKPLKGAGRFLSIAARRGRAAAVLAGSCLLFFQPLATAGEAETESTLDRIARTGVLRIGYGETIPFSFRTHDGKADGYSIELCRELAESIREKLSLERIGIEYVQRTASNRIQLLNAGSFDIDCSASTNTPERIRAVAFAPPHFFSTTRFASLAHSRLNVIDDLKGRSVSVTLGTVNVALVTQISRERHLNLAVVPTSSIQTAFELVGAGKVAAFAMDEALLIGLIGASGHHQDYALSRDAFDKPKPYGFMTRLSDPDFADTVAALLRDIYRGPRMRGIYDRWFMQPILGGTMTMNLPMSPELAASMGLAP